MTLLHTALNQTKWQADEAPIALVLLMQSVPFEFVQGLAAEFGAVECLWRESEHSFTGFVAEVWFSALPGQFATRWAAVVGYPIKVLTVPHGQAPGRFVVRVPVMAVQGQVKLGWPSRSSRMWFLH